MLIVIAEKEELKLVEELGYIGQPIIITGVGGMNVIEALKDLPRDTEIINIGYCGSNHFEVGKIIEVITVETNHTKAKFCEALNFLEVNDEYDDVATCYTSTDFVTETNIEEPCIFDMELAFIRAMFPKTRAIKVVSDNLNKKEYKEKIKNDRES